MGVAADRSGWVRLVRPRAAGRPNPEAQRRSWSRRELLGGKGANQAVGLTQLGVPQALVGVVGDDSDGDVVRSNRPPPTASTGQAVARRGPTAPAGRLSTEPSSRRLFEDIPSTAKGRTTGVLDGGHHVDSSRTRCRWRAPRPTTAARVVADGAVPA